MCLKAVTKQPQFKCFIIQNTAKMGLGVMVVIDNIKNSCLAFVINRYIEEQLVTFLIKKYSVSIFIV